MSTGLTNGILYVGHQAPSQVINNQSINMAVTQTIENGVLAGPISIPATITVTGTLVVV